MKIIYNENPLKTEIILNNTEKKLFFYKIILELIFYDLDELENTNEAIIKIKNNYYDNKSYYHECYNFYLKSLTESHGGDCTSMRCPCSKCYSEYDILNIATIDKLPSGYVVDQRFTTYNSLNDVIRNLKRTVPNDVSPEYKDKFLKTIEWLQEYKKTKLKIKEEEIEFS